jgi:hypothetical protein
LNAVIALYLLTTAVLGLTLATVFQLAHCVEEATFRNRTTWPNRGVIAEPGTYTGRFEASVINDVVARTTAARGRPRSPRHEPDR